MGPDTVSRRALDPPLLDDGDPDAPLERRTTVQLARALAAAELATRRSAASNLFAPY